VEPAFAKASADKAGSRLACRRFSEGREPAFAKASADKAWSRLACRSFLRQPEL